MSDPINRLKTAIEGRYAIEPEQVWTHARRLLTLLLLSLAACGGTESPTEAGPVATTVAISPTTLSFSSIGETQQLTASVRDQNGAIMSGAAVTWMSSASNVASVSSTGLVTAVADGTATITATSGSATGDASVTVLEGEFADPAGGEVSLADEAVNLVFPAGAVSEEVFITAKPATESPVVPGLILGTAFDLGPDGIVFDQRVTLTIGYDPANLPTGVPEEWLRLHKLVDGVYVRLDSAVVDVENNTVSSAIDGFSTFAILGRAAPRLTHQFSHASGKFQSSATVGIWMFKSPNAGILPTTRTKPKKLEATAIADWLDTEGPPEPGDLYILEPINVIWIDYTATDKAEARQNVKAYLSHPDRITKFFEEGGLLHSYGYWGWYADFDGNNGDFEPQWPAKDAWVDQKHPAGNNHGRVFASVNVGTQKEPVFYTLGAFSRETEYFSFPLFTGHHFDGFHIAQQAVLAGASPGEVRFDWNYERLDTIWGSVLVPGTIDHKGVAVLVLMAEIPGTWDLTGVSSVTGGITYITPPEEIAADPLSRVFREDGTGTEDYQGSMKAFTWSTSGGTLTLSRGGQVLDFSYAVNSTTMTLEFDQGVSRITHTFTRR